MFANATILVALWSPNGAVVTDAALNTIDDMPVMEELDQVPTLQELSKAIDMLHSGKALGRVR